MSKHPVSKGPVAILAVVIFVFFMVFAACSHNGHHHNPYKAPTETNAPATVIDKLPDSAPVEPAPQPAAHPNEGDPGWDCHTMGNKQCGPGQG